MPTAIKTGPGTISAAHQPPRIRSGRAGDLILACALIAFTLPLLAIISVAIKCDSHGPVFCREERVRAGGRRIALLKFRTTAQRDERARRRGWQLTRMGQFLRYTRMDELPRLLNLVRGEVTLTELFES